MPPLTAHRSDRTWVVTGAAGFLGNVIVRELVARGAIVRALVHRDMAPASLAGVECERMRGDILDPGSLRAAFTTDTAETVVVHAAAVVSIAARLSPLAARTNTTGVTNVIDACRETGASRLIHVSSVHATPAPTDGSPIREVDHYDPAEVVGAYAKSKAEGSRLVAESGLDWVITQPSGLIGPGDFGASNLTRLIRAAALGRLGGVTRGGYDFVDVRDVAESIIAAAFHGRAGESYLLTGDQAAIADVVGFAAERGGHRAPPLVPMALARAIAPLVEFWGSRRGRTPLMTPYSLHTLTSPDRFDHSKATAELDHTPRPLDESVFDTVDWLGLRASAR